MQVILNKGFCNFLRLSDQIKRPILKTQFLFDSMEVLYGSRFNNFLLIFSMIYISAVAKLCFFWHIWPALPKCYLTLE